MKDNYKNNLNLLEFILTIVFLIEVIIKLIILKKIFISNFYNKIDLIIAISNLIAIIANLIIDKTFENQSDNA